MCSSMQFLKHSLWKFMQVYHGISYISNEWGYRVKTENSWQLRRKKTQTGSGGARLQGDRALVVGSHTYAILGEVSEWGGYLAENVRIQWGRGDPRGEVYGLLAPSLRNIEHHQPSFFHKKKKQYETILILGIQYHTGLL